MTHLSFGLIGGEIRDTWLLSHQELSAQDDRRLEAEMMTFLRRNNLGANERILIIEAGQVVCPRRGIVDIEQGWVCPAYGGGAPGVADGLVCSAEPVTPDPRAGLI